MAERTSFVDSSCWIGLLSKNDESHLIAKEKYESMFRQGYAFVTSSAVLFETANALSHAKYRQRLIEVLSHDRHFQQAGFEVLL